MRRIMTVWLLAASLAAGMVNSNVYGAGNSGGATSAAMAEVSGSDGTYMAGAEFGLPEKLELAEDVKAAGGEFASATPIRLGNAINGSITETADHRLYQFTLSESGRVTLDLTSYMQYCSLYIYGSDGAQIWCDEYNEWNANLKYFKETYDIDLTNGAYYLKVTGYQRGEWKGSTGTYGIATKFASAGESCTEPNNDFREASVIGINGTVRGQIAENDRYDVYQFSMQKPGRIGLTMTYYMKYNSIY